MRLRSSRQGMLRIVQTVWISSLVVTTGLTASGTDIAFGQVNQTGRWTQPTNAGADWGHNQIHLALMRGSGTSPHSYIWTWQTGTQLGLRGWNPGTWDAQNPGLSDGTTYPTTSFSVVSPTPLPGADIFCSGHTSLEGKLLVAGGNEPGTSGIKAARVFDPSTLTWSNPGPPDMSQRRWYPTLTGLPSGNQVLTNAGFSFQHMLAYGGTQDPTSETSTTRNEVQRFQLTVGGEWDAHGSQSGASLPDPREGHTAVVLDVQTPPVMVMYGGRTSGGGLKEDVWTLMAEQTNAFEAYHWTQLTSFVGDPPPGFRVRHTAVARVKETGPGQFERQMIIFGGKNQSSQTEDRVHRLGKNALGQWEWRQLSVSGTAPKRSAHGAIYDAANDRMLVFGGRDENNSLAGTQVHALSLGATPAWSTPSVSGSAPVARDGHTMVVDPDEYTRAGGAKWKRVIVYGGHDGSTRKGDVWSLWTKVTDPSAMEWEQATVNCPSGCAPERTRHAALWDGARGRLVVFGGDTGGNPSAASTWVLNRVGTSSNQFEWQQLPGSSLGVAGQTVVTSGAIGYQLHARQPELFTLGGSPVWTTGSPTFQTLYQSMYPFMFVMPSGNVFYAGSTKSTRMISLTNGFWGTTYTSPLNGGSAVMYKPGEIMKSGSGGTETGNDSTAKIVFDASDQTTGWTIVGEMAKRRWDHNLTVLPSGNVLATGGYDKSAPGSPAVTGPEIWDPATGNWTGYGTLAADPAVRGYHSCALILPDARILSVGGSSPPPGDPAYDPNINRATIFTPPYLFDPNGKFVDDPAAQSAYRRPVIAGLPCRVGYSTEFEVRSPQALDIHTGGKACLIRPGAVTHAFNQDQRYIPLTIANCPGGDRLRITAPANANLAPPGDYLLFLVSSVGVPSIAKWVRVGNPAAWNCTDVTTPAQPVDTWVDLVSDSQVWLLWTAPGDDGTGGPAVSEYDLRGSSQPITDNASLCAGIRGSVPPTPGSLVGPGGMQDGAVIGLSPCTQYRFAAKARDDVDNWGPISNETVVTTLCGGGGGGNAEGPVNASASRSIETDWARESIRLTSGIAVEPQASGSLLAADSGGDPGALVAEIVLTEGNPTWRIYSVGSEAAAGLFAGDSARILVSEPASTGWRTVSRRFPNATSVGFALRGFGRTARYVFRDALALQQASSAVRSPDGAVFRATFVRHSRLGNQTALLQTTDGTGMSIGVGDTLDIHYERGALGAETAKDQFLLIGASGSSAELASARPSDPPAPDAVPSEFSLEANQPNPFARSTTVAFALPRAEHVRLEVFDLLGRRVRVLAEGVYPAGRHQVAWNARDGAESFLGAGVYLCRITAGEFRARRTMVLLP